jgi:hypothetical protein
MTGQKRFDVDKLTHTFWEVFDDCKLVGYVSCGTAHNFYFTGANQIVIKEGFSSMQAAYEAFVNHLMERGI